MNFDSSRYLARATARAKSDVANKLVSMFLHDLSRRCCIRVNLAVTDRSYTQAVAEYFGHKCCYCGKRLESDRVAVEHLNGMNRFRCGLHIPGNVVVACRQCNSEKRRDDSLKSLVLANSGWESFLSHGFARCDAGCRTCLYWSLVWPDECERQQRLIESRSRLNDFVDRYPDAREWSLMAREKLTSTLDSLYRECQSFATDRIASAVERASMEMRL